MKLKQILAGLVAGAMASTLVIQTAGAEEIATFTLYKEIYTGTISITGTIDAGDTPLDSYDILWLGNTNLPQAKFADLAAAKAGGFDNALGNGKRSDTSATTFVYSEPTTASKGLELHGAISDKGFKIGSVDATAADWYDAFTVSSIKIGTVNATLTSASDRAGAVGSIATAAADQKVIWKVSEVADEYGVLAKRDKAGVITYTITYKYTGNTLDPDSATQKIIKALKDMTTDEQKEFGAANSFNLLWETDPSQTGTGKHGDKFGTGGTVKELPTLAEINGGTLRTGYSWVDDDAASARGAATSAIQPASKSLAEMIAYLADYFAPSDLVKIANFSGSAGSDATALITGMIGTTVTTGALTSTVTVTTVNASSAKDALITNITNAYNKKANVTPVTLTAENLAALPVNDAWAVQKTVGTYGALLLQPKSTTVNLSGISSSKKYTDSNVNLIEQLQTSAIKKIEAAAKSGQNLYVTAKLSAPVKNAEGVVVLGRETFLGKDTVLNNYSVKKGDTEAILEISASDVIATYGNFNLQWIWYGRNASGGSVYATDGWSSFTVEGSYQWNYSGSNSSGSIIDPAGGNAGLKDFDKIFVESFIISTGAPSGGANSGYAATKDGAIAAVKDYLAGKTGKDIAIGAVKAYIAG